jgi:hypothetical protein
MANAKHLDIVRVCGCEVVDASKAEKKSENSADKIQIFLAARRWIPGKDKLMSVEHAKFFEFWLKFKVTLPVWEQLKSHGLRKGSIADFEFASDGWTQQNSSNSGSWYQFLGLIKLDGKDINYFVYDQKQVQGFGSSWESSTDTELVGAVESYD